MENKLQWDGKLLGKPVTYWTWIGGIIHDASGKLCKVEGIGGVHGWWEPGKDRYSARLWDGCIPFFPPEGFNDKTEGELWMGVTGYGEMTIGRCSLTAFTPDRNKKGPLGKPCDMGLSVEGLYPEGLSPNIPLDELSDLTRDIGNVKVILDRMGWSKE